MNSVLIVVGLLLVSTIAFASPTVAQQYNFIPISTISTPVIGPINNSLTVNLPCIAMKKVLREYSDYLLNTPGGYDRYVYFDAVSNQEDGTVTFTSGSLKYDKASDVLFGGIDLSASSGNQLFSNRGWSINPCSKNCENPGYIVLPKGGPFNPDKADKLGLTIDIQRCAAALMYYSAGSRIELINLKYENGVFYGFTGSPPKMFVISLWKGPEVMRPR